MSSTAVVGIDDLSAELRRLCERLPIPHDNWHPGTEQLVGFRADFEQALALATANPRALERLAALLDADVEPSFDHDASPTLTAAWRRLDALPLPSGQHPFLDDILPAVEAYRLLLIALSNTTAG